ncbi:hypothetical protein GPALN_006243 [Globodera pallida]|nr:hypothetical protein GPALN_006243 [Globodera pallida]
MAAAATAEVPAEQPGRGFMSAIKRRREQDRKEWAAYWEVQGKEAENSYMGTWRYHIGRFGDWPATWFRENIVEPLHDKHKMPYYHRKISRVHEVDQCGVNDRVCLYEAEEQFRLDKLVDHYIRDILFNRFTKCVRFNGHDNLYRCAKQVDDFENADLNFFIKYGELGSEQTLPACYMKQKHRLIWERRHPEIMEERKRAYEEHMENLRNGKFNMHFWRKDYTYRHKRNNNPGQFFGPYWDNNKLPSEGDTDISRDWRYYRKLEDDPNFDTFNYPKEWNEMAKTLKEVKEQHKQKMSDNGNGSATNNGNGSANNGNGSATNNGNGGVINGNGGANNGNGSANNGNVGNE